MQNSSAFRLCLLISIALISACDNGPISEKEKTRLPELIEINSTLCNNISPEQMIVDTVRIPLLQNQYSLEISDMQRCGMHMQTDLIHSKSLLPSSSGNGQYFTATSIGLKTAGFEVDKNYQQAENILGKYMSVSNEGEFFGLVYASDKGPRTITAYFFGMKEHRKKDVFAFINHLEHRFYAPDIELK